jgi:hypothetical protein
MLKTEARPLSHALQKIHSKLTKDLNARTETLKPLGENT